MVTLFERNHLLIQVQEDTNLNQVDCCICPLCKQISRLKYKLKSLKPAGILFLNLSPNENWNNLQLFFYLATVCYSGYHLFGEICIKLVPLVNSFEVIDLCPNDGGTASLHFLMSNLPQLEYYLSYIWHTPEDAAYIGIIAVANNITDKILCFEREQFGTFQISYGSCSAEDIYILCGRDATGKGNIPTFYCLKSVFLT